MSAVFIVVTVWLGWTLGGLVQAGFLPSEEDRHRKFGELGSVTLFAVALGFVLWMRGAA